MTALFKKKGGYPDYFLIALILLLTTAGLLILTSASSDLGKTKFNDSYFYLKHQLVNGLLVGLMGLLITAHVHYHYYRKIAFFLLFANVVFLGLVFTQFGVAAGGANRWLALGPITFQPAEILKATFILYLAAWLSNPKIDRAKSFSAGGLPFLIIFGVIAGLLFLQPATSTVVILLGAGGITYLLSGARWKDFFIIGLCGATVLGLVIWQTPYRLDRIKTFLDPNRDVQGASFQINQALITIGSGELWGIGYGKSTTKVNYLPAPIGDSIFAVAAQELGFVGAGTLVVFFSLLVLRIFWIAKNAGDKFGKLYLIGFGTLIALQSLINIGAISGFLPLTGVPLPFVSYGGTALAMLLIMSGVAINISKYTYR